MPEQELPAVYDPAGPEERWYSFWEEHGYFHADPKPGVPRFCITIPPPNVTGELHIGHALQHAIHDAVIRYQRMLGKVTLCVPGTDHAGIGTQVKVEAQLAAALQRHGFTARVSVDDEQEVYLEAVRTNRATLFPVSL